MEKYGISSVNHNTKIYDEGVGIYKHEIIFTEDIDISALTELAQKSGFNVIINSLQTNDQEPLYLRSGFRSHTRDARVYLNSIKYNDKFKIRGPKAKELIWDYGVDRLGWNHEDVTLKVIMGDS